ncbi:MAG: hypothetical protein K2Z81_06140, partial [Cyanobacteria bacterium]|nr:hypothetical protein [Cyanobacteriota bacterium]
MTEEATDDAQSANGSPPADLPAAAPPAKKLEILTGQFKRAAWKHYIRYFVVATILLLDVSTVMSFITRLQAHNVQSMFHEFVFFLIVGIVNLLFLVPVMFEVNRVNLETDGLGLTTLFWRTRLSWSQITEFTQPMMLKYGVLKTKHSFYLINKRDFKQFKEIAETI